jgi:hypothetical protein
MEMGAASLSMYYLCGDRSHASVEVRSQEAESQIITVS